MNAENRKTEDARGTSFGSSAPLSTNAVSVAEDRRGERCAQPALDGVSADRAQTR
jgi:hypothetical protein